MPTEPVIKVLAKTKGHPTECRSARCGRPIVFYRTFPGNKAMPFDGDPLPVAREVGPGGDEILSLPAALNHFGTCPERDRFSRKVRR